MRTALVLIVVMAAGAARSQNLLDNPGFENGGGNVASGWYQNTWPGGQQQYTHYSRETSNVHGGLSAQKVTVDQFVPDSGTILIQDFEFPRGRSYEGRVWVRAEAPMKVAFYFRKSTFWYNISAARMLTVGTGWQELVIRGGYREDFSGQFIISPQEPGTLIVDDASLTDITGEVLNRPVFSDLEVVPPGYFGIHINKLGTHHLWPPLDVGLLRLWDTATTWAHVEPEDGCIHDDDNWQTYPSPGFRLTYYLDHVADNCADCEVIYTLGVSPLWAVAAVSEPDCYVGTAWPPDDLEDWRDYVRVLGERFDGRIHHWEVWNEVNYGGFYLGDVSALCDLTRIAAEELKAINPANTILSPNFTISGMLMLDDFLEQGCASEVDVLSWHLYGMYPPEDNLPALEAVLDLVRRHGLEHLPLWNTEGAVELGGADPSVGPGAVARLYLVQWAYGVRQFSWYMWDDAEAIGRVMLHESPDPQNPTPPSAAGIAYRETAGWLSGARMIEKLVEDSPSGGQRWQLTITRDPAYRGWILWDTGGPSSFNLPPDWGATTQRTLDGLEQALSSDSLSLDIAPVLVENPDFDAADEDGGSPDEEPLADEEPIVDEEPLFEDGGFPDDDGGPAEDDAGTQPDPQDDTDPGGDDPSPADSGEDVSSSCGCHGNPPSSGAEPLLMLAAILGALYFRQKE